MKRGFKKLLVLSLVICLFSSYQETAGNCCSKCSYVPFLLNKNNDNNNTENSDYDLLLMPISNFILIQ